MPSPAPKRRPGRRPPARTSAAHLRVVRSGERPRRRPARSRDAAQDRVVGLLVVVTASLTLIGIAMVLSASSVSAYDRFGSSFLFFNRHVVFAVAGALVAVITSRMRYGAWERLCAPVLLVTIGLLFLVLVPGLGRMAGGSARWISIGPVTLQPSELAKLATVAFLAALLSRRLQTISDPRRLAVPAAPVVALVCGLILLQPDMGTAVVVLGAGFVVAFAAGARLRHLMTAAVATGLVGFVAIYAEGYRWARFMSFTDPWADPQGGGYQTIQSLIGLGSGGLFGVGLGAGRQKWLFVPNAHTDFIYSIIGEELGLLGALLVLALFGLFVYAGLRIALRAPDGFGRLLAIGITSWIGFQALVNLGAVTGMLPITGVPLPFVSFGGSSLIVSLAAVGVLISIGRAGATRRS